jgi:hypothetical protein
MRIMLVVVVTILGAAAANAKCTEGDVNGLWLFYSNAPANCAVEFVNGGKVANGVCHYQNVAGPKTELSGSAEFNARCEIVGTLKEKLGRKTQDFSVAARVREGKYAVIAEGTTQTPDGVTKFFGVKQW